MNIKFSFLIATLNRPELLKACVKGLLNQTYDNYEIIIVDQSDKEQIDDTIATMDDRINYIHIKRRGLSHARNIGLNYVSGDYVCLIDDDALYDENYLSLSSEMIGRISPTALIGVLLDPHKNILVSDLTDCTIHWKNAFKGLCSACMILKTDFLKSVMFDEKFGLGSVYGSGEDTDVLFSALHQNKVVYFTSKNKIYHGIPSIDEIPLQKLASYSYGAGALFKKTIINYSKFWGCYYLLRTVVGNLLVWIFQSLKKNNTVAEARKVRAVYTLKGFLSYK